MPSVSKLKAHVLDAKAINKAARKIDPAAWGPGGSQSARVASIKKAQQQALKSQ